MTMRASRMLWTTLAGVALALAAAAGCDRGPAEENAPGAATGTEEVVEDQPEPKVEPPGEVPPMAAVDRAMASLLPTEGNEVGGLIALEQLEETVRITGTIEGLEPGSVHGFHIHEYGDCSAPDGTSAGGHYAPEGQPHGLPEEPQDARHAGDLGNVEADDEGTAKVDMEADEISIARRLNPVLGRAFILHADRDDGGQPTGNAGARLACGTIAIAGAE